MSDETTQPEIEAPAETPAATPAFDVEKFKSELTASFTQTLNDRIAGIQSGFQKQINEKDAEIRKLRLESMSDSDKARFEDDEAEAYVKELERKAALGEVALKYPQVAEAFEKLMGAESHLSQAELLASLMAAKTPVPAATPDPEVEVPDVLPNNPAPKAGTLTEERLPDGTPLTEESAEAFLKALGDTPLARLR